MTSQASHHPSSYRDPSGFLFVLNNILYRQVNKVYQADYDLLMQSGLYKDLTTKELLIPHDEVSIEDIYDQQCYKIIEPEKIPFISYPYEWCFDQLKDAALLTLKLTKEALSYGMILKDASAFNVQFYKGKPVFIDTLSFTKYNEQEPWIAYRQFCEHFYGPLALMHYLKYPLAPLLLTYPEGIPVGLASRLLSFKSRLNVNVSLHIHLQAKISANNKPKANTKRHFSKTKLLNILNSLESSIESFQLNNYSGVWSGYYEEALSRTNYIEEKKKIIEQWMQELPHVRTAFDAGANEGLFSNLISNRGILTISADSDHFSVNRLYNHCKKTQDHNILPLVIDLAHPTPSIGVNNTERQSLTERAKTDLVLALAVIHHLCIGMNIPFSFSAEQFQKLGKYLLIEFVPKTDNKVQEMLQFKEDIYEWYTEENFKKHYGSYYQILRESSIGSSGRKLFLMKSI